VERLNSYGARLVAGRPAVLGTSQVMPPPLPRLVRVRGAYRPR
jgi:hypothetical protein